MQRTTRARKQFAEHYFGIPYSLRTKTVLTRRASHITTFIIDTSALTNGKLLFDRTVPYGGSKHDVLATARKAVTSHQPSALSTAIGQNSSRSLPVSIISDRVQGTVWHHGEGYSAAWVGKPTSIAHHADLSDTEREQLLLHIREISAHGSQVYAVAMSDHHTQPHSYNGSNATVIGLLVFHPQMYDTVETTVAAIRQKGFTIVYASKDSEQTVQTLAKASLIEAHAANTFVYRPGRKVPPDYTLYASLTDKARQSLMATYDPTTMLEVTEPITDFWPMFKSFLR